MMSRTLRGNLRKCHAWRKGERFAPLSFRLATLFAAITLLPPDAITQNRTTAIPTIRALASSTFTSREDPWAAVANPAAAARTRRSLLASCTPSDQILDGDLLAAFPIDSTAGVVLAAGGSWSEGYREGSVRLGSAITIASGLELGAAVSFEWVAIDRYGSSSTAALDVGALAEPMPGLRVAFVIDRLAGGSLSDSPPPTQTALGLALDLSKSFTLSLDLLHARGWPARASLGITTTVIDEVDINCAIADEPVSLSFGTSIHIDGIVAAFGMQYVDGIGVHETFGAGVSW